MDYYFNVLILPDTEFPSSIVMNALYANFHKALCDMRSVGIGVSFPKYNVTLGNTLRIHGNKDDLSNLYDLGWIGGMKSHCNVSSLMKTPEDTKFRVISRKQKTMSQSKLRRLLNRGSISKSEIKIYEDKIPSKNLKNPFIELVSNSSKQKYRRYITFSELLKYPVSGKFDQFGLSKVATIPWFE